MIRTGDYRDFGFKGPRDAENRSYMEWLMTLDSRAALPDPLTRNVRRTLFRAEVWNRWAWRSFVDPKDNKFKQNRPLDDAGLIPRRIRRAIAAKQFKNLETESRRHAARIKSDPEKYQQLLDTLAGPAPRS